MKNAKRGIKFKRFCYGVSSRFSEISKFFLFIIVLLLWVDISLTVVYIQECAKCRVWGAMRFTVSILLNVLGVDNANEFPNVTELINIFLGFSGIILTIYTVFSYIAKGMKLKKSLPVTRTPVFETGVDDIAVMQHYYREAQEITVFSSSFLWMVNNEDIFSIFFKLAVHCKLYLFTCGNIDNVTANLLNTCPEAKKAELQIIINRLKPFKQPKGNEELRCSYVKRNQAKYVLYKYEDNTDEYVYVIKPKEGAEYLLCAFGILINNIEITSDAD